MTNPFGTPGNNDAVNDEFSFDFTDYTDGYAVDNGDYDAKVIDMVQGTSKSSGNPMITVTYALVEGKYAGKEFKDFMVMTPAALFKVAAFCKAIGKPIEGKVSLKKDECLNKRVVLRLKQEEYNGTTNSKIDKVLPHADGPDMPKAGDPLAKKKAAK